MSFASDAFTGGSPGTELSAFNAAWSKQTGYSQNGAIGNDLNPSDSSRYAYHAGTSGYAVYQHSGTPASADYSVFAKIFRGAGTPAATGPQMGVCGRMQSGAGTFYAVIYEHGSTRFSLYRFVAGSNTLLGSRYTYTLTTTPVQVELRLGTSGSDPTLSVHLDGGAAVISHTDTHADKITTAGKAGLILYDMRQTGVNDTGGLDDWSAVDAGGGGGGSSNGAAAYYYAQQ